jgi:hypothetical protein
MRKLLLLLLLLVAFDAHAVRWNRAYMTLGITAKLVRYDVVDRIDYISRWCVYEVVAIGQGLEHHIGKTIFELQIDEFCPEFITR